MRVLVIGKHGQLARELAAVVEDKAAKEKEAKEKGAEEVEVNESRAPADVQLLCLGRADVDILQPATLAAAVDAFDPEVMINASGYTQVDKAETDIAQAFAINETAVANMAKIAAKRGIRFIHVSSDYVFDGDSRARYGVGDAPKPLNVYGASKLAGELALARIIPPDTAMATIVRSSWVYSQYGNNFVNTMLGLMQQKTELAVVADQVGCPTYARGLAEFIWRLTQLDRLEPIYHWCDLGQASWHEFAVAIQETALELGLLPRAISITPISSEQYPSAAKRPHFSVLDVSGSLAIMAGTPWREQLNIMLSALAGKRQQ
ncbi:dTDP-4-dehydrorhamnose reductase [Shewanella salipaludis]|uniref:dTDP-4-dehydrorhamnose reductase n=1 Tax=Shewanella salipaludis TaxID=2723052 RepID=A0A972FYL2_9GAMM|nr:dTDP-4-dehydrorhamnose reductase [Shewanella salipaludis]NMH65608.1 dTDP-4-dehydrorhamnose reductase [Shewanella salipaludis]